MILLWRTEAPNIWTDGSREDFSSVGGFEVAGAGVCVPALELAFDGAVWGVAEEYVLVWSDAVLLCLSLVHCRLFSVQSFGVPSFIALQSCWPCHLCIDNLNVARSIGGLLDHGCLVKPLPLVKDEDFVALAQHMIQARGRDTVGVTKVKGHATDSDVELGRVRLEDNVGNAEADTAADLGRRHQSDLLMDAGRVLLNARNHWYPIMLQLHRFMIAVARVAVNQDDALDPLVWDQGGPKKARKLDVRVNVDLASLPGPPGFLDGSWMQVHGGGVTDSDVAAWPYSVGILCKFTGFLGSLHWPIDAVD